MATQTEPRPALTLDDRYLRKQGRVYLGGIQALVRLPIEQQRRDRAAGLRTGIFISGYPGSPLGSYDLALRHAEKIADEYGIRHVPGANEELAATAISGTQMLDHYPHSEYDGVVAFWYGKGPGVDRAGDALKHGNFAGTSKHGAVVVLAGEDHEAKSSTMPFQDDYAFMSHGMPILYPSSVAEFLSLGLHAVALSRFSGCWVAFKLVGQLCDGGETVEVGHGEPRIVIPDLKLPSGRAYVKPDTDFTFFPGLTIEAERKLYYERHLAVRAYGRANHLDQVLVRSERDRVGIITAGKSYADVRQALLDVGLGDEATLRHLGIRLLKMALIYPLDQDIVREFADGLDEVIVVEEKRGFLEAQVKEALCGLGRPIRVVGKSDEQGAPLFPIHGGMDADLIAERLGARLLAVTGGAHQGILNRLAEIRAVRSRQYELLPMRTPNYCSGCPHNTSTQLLEGELAWGSPGCHSFASVIEQPERHIESMTQYGGEGLPWIGLEPYTDRQHMVQHVGDGSLFHSSYLNIRFAASVGAHLTYKVLFNGSIANTGAQSPTGAKTVPELVRLLEIEGVRRIALLTKDVQQYADCDFSAITSVYDLDHQEQALVALRETPGTTVMIYDGMCANERRRQQKRGKLPTSNRFVVINEDVCENCGHCGALTNCMSLHKVETEHGPKTQVHQSSCNQDYSCLGGDCPSFVTVETKPGTGLKKPRPPQLLSDDVPEPCAKVRPDGPYEVYIPGVGGTGVLTVNALLSFAATMDGKRVVSYDQTGAAQKWGAVLSSLVIADDADAARLAANRVGVGRADLYLAFDPMGGSSRVNLDRCDPARTVAVVNTGVLPSGEMIRDVHFQAPLAPMKSAIERWTRAERNVYLDAQQMAESLFGDYMATNLVALGAAYQAGLLPLAAGSIEAAIQLNGVAVEQNIQAFRYGRLQVADPVRVARLLKPAPTTSDEERHAMLARLPASQRLAYSRLLQEADGLGESLQRLLANRLGELLQYQDERYARRYLVRVLGAAARETEALGGPGAVTEAVARGLFKLMAYKDEYEVARLHLNEQFRQRTRDMFDRPESVNIQLHPPFLRALGLKKKIGFGAWFDPGLVTLRTLKRLRGTPFDVFGYAHVRREERRLIGWYERLVEEALERLTPDTAETVRQVADVPDLIRGYEQIKLANVRQADARAADLMQRLMAAPLAEPVSRTAR